MSHPRAAAALVVVALVLALLAFVDKPFFVDDPFFVWQARHIGAHPGDPFGFSAVWFPYRTPGWMLAQNPPGFAYLLALVGTVADFTPVALHIALVVPAILVVTGTFALARALGGDERGALFAMIACAASPAFFVSATTVMTDVTMTALWLWSAVLWLRGLAHERATARLAWCAAAGALLAAAVLVKYAAIVAVPVLALCTVCTAWGAPRARALLVSACALVIPVAALIAYELWMRATYGLSSLLDAADYATQHRPAQGIAWRTLATLAFAGGGALAPALLILVAACARRGARAIAVLSTSIAVLAVIFFAAGAWWWAPRAGSVAHALTSSFFVVAGLAIAGAALVVARDRARWWLLAWLGGVVVWSALLNWSPNARAVLPAVPVACVVAGLFVSARPATAAASLAPSALTAPSAPSALTALTALSALSALVCFFVARADASLAEAQCNAGSEIASAQREPSATVWFLGHWGFQWCAEEAGAVAFDAGSTVFRPGDVLAVPANNAFVREPPADAFTPLGVLDIDVMPGLSTMDPLAGAGFYGASLGGPLPFAPATTVDRTRLYRATREFRWGSAPAIPARPR